jgi:kinesin family protein 5
MISNMNQSLNNNLNTSVASSLNSNSTSKTFNQNATHNSGNINVISRFRPLNEKEKSQSKDLCVDFFGPQDLSIKSTAENNNTYKFTFDRIFDYNSTQQEVYEVAAKPIVDSVLEGFNGTIFAYGQTSSGKTHTMQGILENPEKEGIIPRMIRYVFNYILHSKEEVEFTVKVSMIEIYMEKIRDLIDTKRSNLNIREDRVKGVYIEDLSEHYVGNEMEVLELMKIGSDNRAIAATNMNDHSSRSHSIFIMTIHQNNLKDSVAKTGKLYLVDLAGSEKISKTGATGHTLEEAKMINRSLTCLGMVINNLTDGKSTYIPYRDSKLTRVLSESLGGNAKTTLVITCSPSTYNESETLSTLRFGLRAKKIKNKPKINKEVTVAELKLEIDRLERFLVVCNKRIVQLENFIVKNGLVPPKEGEVDSIENNFHPNPQKIENLDGNKSKLAKLNEIVSEIQCIKLSDDKN